MELTKVQQEMFDGEKGEAVQQAMEILVALGKIYGANEMIPISSAQIAGVSYKTLGDAGIAYLQDYAKKGAKVKVKTFLNPAGLDREQWQKMKIPASFAKKSIEALDAFEAMGITMTCTCTPYYIGIRPKVGEHVAWAESSAVCFCNSVLGARTNREGGPSALAAAICGFTSNFGFHLDENRKCKLQISVETEIKSNADFGALGAWAGQISKDKNPAFSGIKKAYASDDKLKALGAAMASWGSVALFNAKNITPEYNLADGAEKISFTQEDLLEMKEAMNTGEKPEMVAIGCPHASIDEIKEVAEKLKGKKIPNQLWVCTARETKQKADKLGYTKTIEDAGGLVVADTCMVVCPLKEMGYACTACNSGKAAKYLATSQGQKVVYGDLEDILILK